MISRRFGAELAALVGRLTLDQVHPWCAVLEQADEPTAVVEASLIGVALGPTAAAAATELVELWRRHAPTPSGAAVALALSTAAQVYEESEHNRPRLVVTGPATSAVAVRLTSSVVLDIVRGANERVLLVSFATHGVTDVVRELAAASDRGVAVDLVLETSVEQGGRLRGSAGSGAFAMLADRVSCWHWPAANRPTGTAALHAKVLVADGKIALLTSANFTDRGLTDNLEVGILLRDPDQAGRLDQHFRVLMRPGSRCLERVPITSSGPSVPGAGPTRPVRRARP